MVYPTTDKDLISRIANHPKVIGWLRDDMSPELYIPTIHPKIIYLVDDTESGVIRIDPMNSVTCSVHMATTPRMWGNAIDMVKEAIGWGFKKTQYLKIQAFIPNNNPYVKGLLYRCGFELEGTLKRSFLSGGILRDQFCYGLKKGDI